ncbi:hypothetical protein [Leptolyngbya sp. FACHB-17]|uniref:hypothetical protein n=1 Tax=unclassified Leptolyngbya TaxID=2650499 RepID=UPI0016801D4E|nr:hypothetical protein [Leptolyngbya sp. FACHB-17]MBD2079319.1 hypothetical protein [Leptolyngbya sp. FACHB-17]
MARGCKTVDFPDRLDFRVTPDQKKAAKEKARKLGYSSVAEMLRAYMLEDIKAA